MYGEDANEIIPGLWLGDQWSTLPENLAKRRIECVLNIAAPETDANRGRYGLKSYEVLSIDDNVHHAKRMEQDVLPRALRFIDIHWKQHNRTILVHCSAGASRSATVVIAWLMHHHGMSFNDALDYVRRCRPRVQPNQGFIQVLKTNVF